MFLPHPRVKVSIAGSLRDREVACSASDRQGSNFESCVWRTVSSQSSHHPQMVLLAQFSLYVHKGGLKPDSFHFLQSARYTLSYPRRQTSRRLILFRGGFIKYMIVIVCPISQRRYTTRRYLVFTKMLCSGFSEVVISSIRGSDEL